MHHVVIIVIVMLINLAWITIANNGVPQTAKECWFTSSLALRDL